MKTRHTFNYTLIFSMGYCYLYENYIPNPKNHAYLRYLNQKNLCWRLPYSAGIKRRVMC